MKKIAATLIMIIIFAGIIYLFLWPKPKTIDFSTSDDGKYVVEFIELESATFFGPQEVEVLLRKGNKPLDNRTFKIYNDGKSLDKSNWSVQFKETHVEIIIYGEEQKDETIIFDYK